jgi:predicted helicase
MSYRKEISTYQEGLKDLADTGGLFVERDTERLFANLLGDISKKNGYFIRSDYRHTTESNTEIRFDTAVFTGVGIVYGIHEAKKHDVDLETAIEQKKADGYPFFNIIFENSHHAILFQNGKQYNGAVEVEDKKAFEALLEKFFSYTSKDIQEYNRSQAEFFEHIPDLIKEIRLYLDEADKDSKYKEKIQQFENVLKKAINPNITRFETREIIVQHLLTIDIFNSVFSEFDFAKYNPVAQEINELTSSVLNQGIQRKFLNRVEGYLSIVKKTAQNIRDFSLKKQFLINFYEQFYKAYNPKGADRLGIVYTPEPVVKFMIESTDYLLDKHFGKSLVDRGVDILDPATGTGTYICALLEYLFDQKKGKEHITKVKNKYKHEIWANEISILPYYIASLTIERIYSEKTDGEYETFEGIIYQDTLDNTTYKDRPDSYNNTEQPADGLFADISEANLERREKLDKKKISVIIGNPPYNANQQNENDNNKNREYPVIDKRIKDTYIKESTAQKTKLFDMYARFIRWASDRVGDEGMIAFITNNSFIDSRTFDGFRKIVAKEFNNIYIINLDGDVRKNTKLSGTKNNVFGIQTGVAISFFIKTGKARKTDIKYHYATHAMATKEEKYDFLEQNAIADVKFEKITPNEKGYWLDVEESDFEDFMPTVSKDKAVKSIFEMSCLGVATNRDSWVYDFSENILTDKAKYFIATYNELLSAKSKKAQEDTRIKWSATLKNTFDANKKIPDYSKSKLVESAYRPFATVKYYAEKKLSDRLTDQHYLVFGDALDKSNLGYAVCLNGKDYFTVATDHLIDLHFTGDSQYFPFYSYDDKSRRDNITDWSLEQFLEYYKDKKITKLNIFHYVYAVLNKPDYVEKYKVELTRDYPRIPFYKNFQEMTALGKELMQMHIEFERVEKHKSVKLVEEKAKKSKNELQRVTPIMKVDKADRSIVHLDTETRLEGIPIEAYNYKLGLRSPIEWVLDQHQLARPSEKEKQNYGVIFEKFNTPENELRRYETISRPLLIDLIPRLATLSLKTLEIREKLRSLT